MGIVVFFTGLGLGAAIIMGFGFLFALLFGGKDRYEEELKRMDFEDALLGKENTTSYVDARSLHFHDHSGS